MSLPTPPCTSHRGKENRSLYAPSTRVAWSEQNEYHTINSSPARAKTLSSSACKELPRSILKKTTQPLFPSAGEDKRETTPEPSDPLTDLYYLQSPVSRIIAADAALRDLIEAYSILAARLRACVTGQVDVDASWPLFQPIRKHRDAIAEAMARDLGRALEDPKLAVADTALHEASDAEDETEKSLLSLPSPKSPKKRRGMSEEQVKHARDLCTTSHSVLKLLSAVFTLPAVYQIFTDEQLRYLMTHVLAIPLAPELPTPNARKTCALAIWLIQSQRLPVEVLEPAKDRIVYALRRGIEGELGKEGKKGSMSDGLQAIHDLSLSYPTLFVPAFADLLPSIFVHLLAPTLVLRSQACHALGGYALAAASIPQSAIHGRISAYVAAYLTKGPPGTPSNKPASPSKDAAIVRTIRTTLQNSDPKHAAQGPVWGLSILANFIVLLGVNVFLQDKVTKCMTGLLSLAMRHQKSSVRGLGCLVWRCVTWAYFQPPPVRFLLAAGDSVQEESQEMQSGSEHTPEEMKFYKQRLNATWKVVQSVVDLGAGIATIGALLATDTGDEAVLRRVLGVLTNMSKKGGQSCKDALETASQLVSLEGTREWSPLKLLPPSLFCANPGLLTAEYRSLAATVKPIFSQCPAAEDVRSFTRDELTLNWVCEGFLGIWKEGVNNLKISWGEQLPDEIPDIWGGLLRANVSALTDAHDEEGIIYLAKSAVDELISILKDSKLNLSGQPDMDIGELIPSSPANGPEDADLDRPPRKRLPPYRWSAALRLFLVRSLWLVMRQIFPGASLGSASEKLLACLCQRERHLLRDVTALDEVRGQWALLCAEVAYACDVSDVAAFWSSELSGHERTWSLGVRRTLWCHFVETWREIHGPWESAVILLGVPLVDAIGWEMSNSELDQWEAFLRLTVSKALDHGVDSTTVLDQVASCVSKRETPALLCSTRIADLLLSHLEMADARQAPSEIFEFVNNTLVTTYPPEPENKHTSIWLLRSLTRAVDACPLELATSMFDLIQEALCMWISDEDAVFSSEEYALDILPMYQTALLVMRTMPTTIAFLEALSPILASAFRGRVDKPEGSLQAFLEFWEVFSSSLSEPVEGWPEKIRICLRASGLQDEPMEEPSSSGAAESSNAMEVDVGDTAVEDCEVEAQLTIASDDDSDALMSLPSTPKHSKPASTLAPPFLLRPVTWPASIAPAIEVPSSPITSSRITISHRSHEASITPSVAVAPPALESCPLLFQTPSPPLLPSPARRFTTPSPRPQSTHGAGSSSTKECQWEAEADKENQQSHANANAGTTTPPYSPLLPFTSASVRSPGVSLSTPIHNKGKRRLSFDAEDVEKDEHSKSLKRPRRDPTHVFGESMTNISPHLLSPEVHMLLEPPHTPTTIPLKAGTEGSEEVMVISVAAAIFEPSGSKDVGKTSPAIPSSAVKGPKAKARSRGGKGVFLDAVEVPTVAQVRKSRRLSGIAPATPSSSSVRVHSYSGGRSSSPARSLRRTRSATRVLGAKASFERLRDSPKGAMHRRVSLGDARREMEVKAMEQTSSSSGEASVLSSPLLHLREADIVGSDDSIMLASTTLHSVAYDQSSDDGLLVGQVTPHRLVSPALRRVQDMEYYDPPSDDSNMSASPSADRVARRMGVAESQSKPVIRITPLNLRRRSLPELFGSD